ncbi:ATP-binding cassette domain-containing protein [Breoghania sp.]|uniref:ATP-binding cassette domain-containing protein n=1 Tax=Breoghania sp. TaxID=2065378 RepID=UPI002628DB2D|nr:ATP-binding cassette domain-containing protein [Breoghania sp.]MDJ0933319.1 ATP-binding cassette domain-containing protein [Breoghania sp.]
MTHPRTSPEMVQAGGVTSTDHEGIRKLFHLVDADLTRIDLSFIAPTDRSLDLDELCRLALPLFTLAVYDQVLAAGDRVLLTLLALGVAIVLVCDFCLRGLRSTVLSRTASLIDLNAKSRLVGRLLRAPSLASININSRSGLARLKNLDRARTFFVGPIGAACLEAPFTLLYVVALLAPLTRRTRNVARQTEEYGATCYEISSGLETIKLEGAGSWWFNRFRDASARLAEIELVRQRALQGWSQIASSTETSLAVLATLGAGSFVAIDGKITVGALIASVALVWRMSAPLPSLMQGYLRWDEIQNAVRSSTAILGSELSPLRENRLSGRGGGMHGRVAFSSVMMTYERGQTAALRNVSFEINPGDIVAITGHSGSGKSTLPDLIAGLREPQFGTVTIDGVNPRQISNSALRQSIGYLARDQRTLPISIADFFNLGVEAEAGSMRNVVCGQLNIYDLIKGLPSGFATPMAAFDRFSSLVKVIGLARVFLTNTNLMLLDEPDAASASARQGLLGIIEANRGVRGPDHYHGHALAGIHRGCGPGACPEPGISGARLCARGYRHQRPGGSTMTKDTSLDDAHPGDGFEPIELLTGEAAVVANQLFDRKGTSRFATIAIALICSFFAGLGIWAYFVPFAEISTSSGEIVPSEQIQTVQHLEGGIVSKITVSEGERVTAGQTLLELAPDIARSELYQLQTRLSSVLLRIDLLQATLEERSPDLDGVEPRYKQIAEVEFKALTAKRESIDSQSTVLSQQVRERRAELKALEAQAISVSEQISLTREQIDARQYLVEKGPFSRMQLIERARFPACWGRRQRLTSTRSASGNGYWRQSRASSS